MYRCYFTLRGQVEEGFNLDVLTLDAAIATGRKMLADHVDVDKCDGLEIWLDRALLYKFMPEADDARQPWPKRNTRRTG